ncbi:N-acetylmuramoyl-L-alanine amidase [Flagellimonas sp. HMM57]|uniref:N-acetylmuramoyl-L-alanine amidase n=1 Tax=unclassified Flagellimonas TaxID=2644544 RepID=UPI0013D31DBA|nr:MULTISPECIES: N-acetylmuramoyl-L-alanine amidase [unclassified Flagellimonas]UII74677.1 N-acetylmuramoyl-L-alanine amidase [Flagellimonas sp. HMM57]
MKSIKAILLWVCASSILLAQENQTVIAEQGDGIFSILRKQGLSPAKYYEEFITINAKNIKDGSMLHVGREYSIPNASDSFKNTGVKMEAGKTTEAPIFDTELANMSLKSRALKDAVYYLIAENQDEAKKGFISVVVENLAKELMVQGATVYIIERDKTLSEGKELTGAAQMGGYIETINKRYLQNSGKYQRLLMIRANGLIANGNIDVAVYHHEKSKEGHRLANNIQNAFKKNSISNRSYKDADMIFKDDTSLFLAKNTLPALSLMVITNASKKSMEGTIPVRSDKKSFTNWIASGILKDYADLKIED